jgi:hypothetical protein
MTKPNPKSKTGPSPAKAPIDTIEVRISYRILELFSAGLYQSPNKAIEELVANSYDAHARDTAVVLPTDLKDPDATIWVIDDGDGMTVEGLHELWWVGRSPKRLPGRGTGERAPIGRFGIGKLASYVMAHELTYITKAAGRYLSVTMNYDKVADAVGEATQVVRDESAQGAVLEQTLELPLYELSESEARKALDEIVPTGDHPVQPIKLFGKDAHGTWTVARLGQLKPMGRTIKPGQLAYVLRTALPIDAGFRLFLNGVELQSPRVTQRPLKTWIIGSDDGVARENKLESRDNPPGVFIGETVGWIGGKVMLYADSLDTGKQRYERDHGVFIRVRRRLVNVADPLFGLNAVSHSTFARFRMEIEADGLDELLRASRETVLDTPEVQTLRAYILGKFNEARNYYQGWLTKKEFEERAATRIARIPSQLSRQPLLEAVRMAAFDPSVALRLTIVPHFSSVAETEAFLAAFAEDAKSPEGIIKDVEFASLGPDEPIAKFEAARRTLYVNTLHPFYANYVEDSANEPYELLAIAEVLTEAYLLEAGLPSSDVKEVLDRRDRFLRELVYSRDLSAPIIAQTLQESVDQQSVLADAVARAFTSLGFDVTPLRGRSEPTGIAVAKLGTREGAGKSTYRVLFDVRSNAAPHLMTKWNEASDRKRRSRYHADFSILIAPEFTSLPEPAEANTLLPVAELARLVLVAATRPLGLDKLYSLFAGNFGPTEVRRWIDQIVAEPVKPTPIGEILEAVWQLQQERPEPVHIAAIAVATPALKKYKLLTSDVQQMLMMVRSLVGPIISLDGPHISLELPPSEVVKKLQRAVAALPRSFAKSSAFIPASLELKKGSAA